MRRSSEISNAVVSIPELSTNSQVQIELELLITNIVKEYVLSWYSGMSSYNFFPRMIGSLLASSIDSIQVKLKELEMGEILLGDVMQLFKHHLLAYHAAREHYPSFPTHSLDSYFHAIKPHPAIEDEQAYIREYAKRIVQLCLSQEDSQSDSVYLLSIDIVGFIVETCIESLSRPDMLYHLLYNAFLAGQGELNQLKMPHITQLLRNIVHPSSSMYYNDMMDMFDLIFKLKEGQGIWTVFFTLIEPLVCGLLGTWIDELLNDFVDQSLTPELLSSLLGKVNQFLFEHTIPSPIKIDEEYAFIPYGKQRRELSQLLCDLLPLSLVTVLGGIERVETQFDVNLLSVFASKQRNKHLLYGLMDIVMHYVFKPINRQRTKSIKHVNSHLKMTEKTHRLSYSTNTAAQSYQAGLIKRKPQD